MLAECEIVMCAGFKNKINFDYSCEKYNEDVIFAVVDGSFRYRIDNGEQAVLDKGKVVFCPKKSEFHREMITPATFLMIKLKFESPLDCSGLPITVKDFTRFAANFEVLSEYAICYDIKTNLKVSHYCRDVLFLLDESLKKVGSPIEREFSYISANYDKEISVESLASQARYTTVHFINLFKKYYNCTPKSYQLELRLKKAQMLLSTTSLSVNEVAQKCGFLDALYFSRVFKAKLGISPMQFKRLAMV